METTPSTKKLLNLGCGVKIHSAWVNVDLHPKSPEVIDHNLLEGVPFPDNSFDMVYHSAVLEHFTKEAGEQFMRECFRVLRPRGILRVVVPDLEGAARAYIAVCNDLAAGKEVFPNHEWMVAELIDQPSRQTTGGHMGEILHRSMLTNEDFIYSRIGEEGREYRTEYMKKTAAASVSLHPTLFVSIKKLLKKVIPKKYTDTWRIGSFRQSGEVHQWMYDQYSLKRLLQQIGFIEIKKQTATNSLLANFSSYELDATLAGTVLKPDSLFMEAVKPNI